MSGIMAATIASYSSPPVASGSILFGTNLSNVLTTGITAPGTDACTYECWFYATSFQGYGVIFNSWTGGDQASDGIIFQALSFTYYATGQLGLVNTGSPGASLNTWTHVAVTKAAGSAVDSTKIWVNGVLRATSTVNIGTLNGTQLALGGRVYTGILGYISNFRYVKGVQVYTGTFTPPTSPLTDTQSAGTNISAITAGQTQLLLNTATAGTYLTDSSSYARTMTPTGSITYSASNPFS